MHDVGTRIRSVSSGVAGLVTERIVIAKGHELLPPLNGSDGAYEERVDLRVQYTDAHGNQAEALIHETDAEDA